MPSITTCRICGADCWTPPEDCAPLCATCLKRYGSLYAQCPRCNGWGVLEPSGFCSFVCKDLYEDFCEAVSRYDDQIETTPAIPAERRTSIPDGWQPSSNPMKPTIQTSVRVGSQHYAVLVKDPGLGRSWGFYEVAGLVARLEQREKLAEALRQVVWCADAEEPSSVRAAQIAAEALEAAGETNY